MPAGTFLGTLDRTPPPFFRQGPSALKKLMVCAALAVLLMVADTRFAVVAPLRAGLATVLLPAQRVLLAPVRAIDSAGDYLRGLQQAREAEQQAAEAQAALAEKARQADVLAAENAELRRLLALGPARQLRTRAAQILFEARDVYSHKVVLDQGSSEGVRAGSPVIDADGVLGQVTRVYPLSAEVTLMVDKDAAIPVVNQRTLQRAAAFGGLRGPDGPMMELRFLPANADVQAGDRLVTSGLDGVYPPGLAVAQVHTVERAAEGGFAHVLLQPATRGAGVRYVLVLEPTALLHAPLAASAAAAASGSASAPASAPGERR